MIETTSSDKPAQMVPCTVCGNKIQAVPEHMYTFKNQTGNSALIIQMVSAVPPKFANQKPDFEPHPICLSCVRNIISNFIAPEMEPAPLANQECCGGAECDKKDCKNSETQPEQKQ